MCAYHKSAEDSRIVIEKIREINKIFFVKIDYTLRKDFY